MHAVKASKIPERADRETIAARWLIEQDDPNFSDAQRIKLARWLVQDIKNCEAYVQLVRAWRWAVLLRPTKPAAPQRSRSRTSKIERRRRRAR
jgi:ferric-dicitrate binding protein FerR (iron transport regulator)